MENLNTFQQKFGQPSERAQKKVRPYMTPEIQTFIQHAPFVVLATSNQAGQCDASPRGGKPGFIKVLDERHLLIPDVAGNRLFHSYQNVAANNQVGLLFFIPGDNNTARVNGTVEVLDKDALDRRNIDLEIFNPDEEAKIVQGLLVTVQEAYGHCPRALKFSNLWDEATIRQNRNNRNRK